MDQPQVFAFIGVLEVLGWWTYRGHEIMKSDTASSLGLSAAELRTTFSSCLAVAETIVAQLRDSAGTDVAYILPILKAMMEHRKPKRPRDPSRSLLFGPLINSNRRCGLPSCRRTALEAGTDLERCRGCGGVEQYCCAEHQREDWERHRAFCKGNRLEAGRN